MKDWQFIQRQRYRLGTDACLNITVTIHRLGVLNLSSCTARTIPVTGTPFNINRAFTPRYWA
jgi:hypothetical protein